MRRHFDPGTSAALYVGPFNTPVAGVRVGHSGAVGAEPFQQLEFSDVDIVVAGPPMLYSWWKVARSGLGSRGHGGLIAALAASEPCRVQNEFCDPVKQPEMDWVAVEPTEILRAKVAELATGRISHAMRIADKGERTAALGGIKEEVLHALTEEFPEEEQHLKELLYQAEKTAMRSQILNEGVRADGRKADEIRPITIEVGFLPRTHGSSLFTRGRRSLWE
jgi:polyribonucleotide nucleotidyltransferase